ncbi:MAG: ribonuclease HII [Candidatus Izemoplasmatales bacterium]
MYEFEEKYILEGYKHIAGTDEAGRGPLAGPVTAAAVILNPQDKIEGLNDSKQLSKKKRQLLVKEIKERALAYAIVFVSEAVIDEINIYQASKKAMIEALFKLPSKPDFILSDAMPLKESNLPFEAIIKGDTLSASIAAASILAKEARDDYMVELAKRYPEYHFEKHKGYPTKEHIEAIHQYGILPVHRKTYEPIKSIIFGQLSFDL